MLTSLKSSVLGGLSWSFIGTAMQFLLRILMLALLSRLLSAEELGLVAAALVVISLAETFSQLGVAPALVQKPSLTDHHVRTGFTLAIALGVCLFLASPLYSAPLAIFFGMPELHPMLSALALVFPLRAAGTVAEALLMRDMRFRPLAVVETVAYSLGYGVTGIVLAMQGHGAWALVWATVTQVLVKSVLLLIVRRHSFALYWGIPEVRDLIHFGTGFTLSKMGNSIALQVDNLIIGRWLGAASLGLYTRAYQVMVTPAVLVGQVIDRVLFPALSGIQERRDLLRLIYRRGVVAIALIVLPFSALFYLLAPEVITILLGPDWLAVVPVFRVLVVGMLFRTSYKISDSVARATGAVYGRAWRQWVYAALVCIGVWVGQHWGLTGAAIGVTAAVVVNYLLMAQQAMALTEFDFKQFIACHTPGLVIAAVGAMVVAFPLAAMREAGVHILALTIATLTLYVLCIYLTTRVFSRIVLTADVRWIARTVAGHAKAILSRARS